MEIRDPVHGSIHILESEIPIITHDFFKRLRNIKQLGFADYIFPGATHTRFIHSIGVMDIGRRVFDKLFFSLQKEKGYDRIKETFKLACLLHDVGHAPLSHSTESVMPLLSELEIPKNFLTDHEQKFDRQATHEDYTIKSIADSSFAESFHAVESELGVDRARIADLIIGRTHDKEYFTINNKNYFPILHQLVSSELDCDRMDYLLRDSYFCGVSYGSYDLDWLTDNLEACELENNDIVLGITERAVVTFDDFLLSRYHMFVMVYFHYRAVCLEQLLLKYFRSSPDEYKIPANIEEYIVHDDHHLMKVLRNSKNEYAQAIVKNKIPKKIYESFNQSQLIQLEKIQQYLQEQEIEFIRSSSLGRLSKYYTDGPSHNTYKMMVVRKLFQNNKKILFPIDQSTDLFKKFSESHAISRLHCDFGSLTEKQKTEILSLIEQS
ncbi:MAG: HD domain-containing protein [Bacteriovoracaceae bacterium]